MVIKKKGDQEEEVQNGWVGHVIPFELVQTTLLKKDYDALKAKEAGWMNCGRTDRDYRFYR